MTIIWTRSADHWPQDCNLLEGTEYQRLPCLSYRDFTQQELMSQLQGSKFPKPHSLIGVLTSAHTIKSLNRSPSLLDKCEKWYVVGKKTRDCFNALSLAGKIADLPQGVKKGADLAQYLCKSYHGKKLTFFLPGAKKRAYKLDEHLQSCGFEVLSCNTYEVQTGIFDDKGVGVSKQFLDDVFARASQPVICFASPSAVLGFTSGLIKHGMSAVFPRCRVVAIGPTTLKACKVFFHRSYEAPDPSVASLVNLAKTLLIT